MKMNNKLENAFKQALDNHELPYDAAAWKAVQKQLPATKSPWYWVGGAAAVVLIVGLASILADNNATDVVVSDPIVNIETLSTTHVEDTQATSEAYFEQSEAHVLQNTGKQSASGDAAIKHHAVIADVTFNKQSDGVVNRTSTTSSTDLPVSSQSNITATSTWNDNASKASISGMHTFYCQNAKVILFAHNVPAHTDVIWNLSDGTSIKGSKAEFNATKELKVRMKLVNSNDKNLSRLTEWSSINVIEAEIPEVVIQKTEKNTKNYVVFANTNPNIENMVWRVDNMVCQAATCASYMTTKGSHSYSIESYDRNGCYASVSGFIDIDEDYNLYVENTFTPNGDGINDVFLPEALKLRAVNFKMTIYDRNGKLLYETTEIARPWDGSTNGQSIEEGVYVWVVTLINEEGQPEQYRGVVNLRR